MTQIQFHGTRCDYVPPTTKATDEVLTGNYRGHAFRVNKQARSNPLAASKYAMKYRGH
ncbi:MAG: DUF4278 domain-containing protein [Cyanobacteria bacterium J06648_11]